LTKIGFFFGQHLAGGSDEGFLLNLHAVLRKTLFIA